MKLNRLFLPALLLLSTFCHSQSIYFRSGTIAPGNNMRMGLVDSLNTGLPRFKHTALLVLRFGALPTEATRRTLSAAGIDLLDYIPDHAYTATVSGRLDSRLLQAAGVNGVFPLSAEQKTDPQLAGTPPARAVKIPGTVDVWISFPKTFAVTDVLTALRGLNVEILSTRFSAYRVLALRIAAGRLSELAAQPFIDYVQAAPSEDQPLNANSRAGSRANLLNADVAGGGRGLNGEGVVLGIGDNADVVNHVDFAGRLIDRTIQGINSGHGHHTTGTMAGAGNGDEQFRGYAPRATIVSQTFQGIFLNAPTYVNDYGMVVTNNSYGDNIECSYYGIYDLYSRLLDQQAFDLPNLQQVFSAGNSGSSFCSPYSPGFHTVLGAYQSAKNVITVGATSDSGLIAPFSSRGPVRDGRTKPEIVAMGQSVISAWPTNIYAFNNGTSMSGPAVSGGLGLLYQRYRQLHGGANPKNGLMKALLCNGAMDRGAVGPDFQYGYGWMNLLRSVEAMEANAYFTSGISTGGQNDHTITVPANTAQLKVLLYWNDPAASPLSAHTLVNDLDLQVTDPASGVTLPKILDTSMTGLLLPATTGADHINNMEQVVINAPAAGTYTLTVKGTAVPQGGSQEYYLVYDAVPTRLILTSPAGGEALVPSNPVANYTLHKITWDATGYPSGTVNLDFSADGGATWSSIATGLDINRSVYSWIIPNVATNQALVRITNTGNGQSSTSNPFTIIDRPTLTAATPQCEGYINLSWTTVTGATDYEVMMLQGSEMKSVAIMTGTTYLFHGLSKDSLYTVSVRARINGKPGRRAAALFYQPGSGPCTGAYSNNDLKLDAITAPKSGRKLTSTQLSAASVVKVRIRNLDDVPISNFTVRYSINGGSYVSEVCTATVPANGSAPFTFSTTADLSAVGPYTITAVVANAGDPEPLNDTVRVIVKQIDNSPLALPFLDNLESADAATYTRDTVGFGGIERYDLTRTNLTGGRARTFINSGIAYSGSKAITLDARLDPAANVNYLYGTFNLTNYTLANDLRLDFMYNSHGQTAHPNDRVWIRGADTTGWILAFDLDSAIDVVGQYKKSKSIELAHLLAANNQPLATSLQVRWGQEGNQGAADLSNGAGFSFDDIRIYEAVNDAQMVSIDSPVTVACGLTSTTNVTVKVRSANADLSSVPVKYRINGGSWVPGVVPFIAAGTTVPFTFGTAADLSAPGQYTIQAVVEYPTDNFHDNDTVTAVVVNTPVISSFPYLQNFEADNGYWYANGKRSTWEYGTPASSKIIGAASGAKAWKTRLAGNYSDLEQSYLYSPCFDLTGIMAPTLSFSVALDLEDCGSTFCDGAWVEYSTDGLTWSKLGTMGAGTNWYNKNNDVWSVQDYTRWHVATIPLPAGNSRLRLRFVMSSDPATNREGIAIDDIHVYSNTLGIYDGSTMASPVTTSVSGNNWVNITSGTKLIASIQPAGQNLGNTDVQAYINTPPVRYTSTQYYHDRNITIKPANALTDSVAVRFYFLDSETERLLAASGCPTCTKPASAYGLGVSKYTDPDRSFENGTISDNQQGVWTYLTSPTVAKVPFDKGYYAEFKVRNFSEFWLNNGAFNQSTALPTKLVDFTARRAGNDVALQWTIATEQDVARYEIEVARGNDALQRNAFVSLISEPALGNTNATCIYTGTDREDGKTGARYYRLKIVNADGSFRYSAIRPVLFDGDLTWQLYPNPSTGVFNLAFQLNAGDLLTATVIDARGSTLLRLQKPADGFLQKLLIDLTAQPAGVYLLKVKGTSGKEVSYKIYKQ